MRRLVIACLGALCAACSQPTDTSQQAGSTSSNPAQTGSGAGDERFYGQERFTLVGTQSGAESGSFTEHVRAWGRTRAEIKDVTLSMAGITRRTHARAVFNGAEVATVDLETGNVTTMTNPLYARVVEGMRGRNLASRTHILQEHREATARPPCPRIVSSTAVGIWTIQRPRIFALSRDARILWHPE